MELQYKYKLSIYKNGGTLNLEVFIMEIFLTIAAICEKMIYLCKTSINSPLDSSYKPI